MSVYQIAGPTPAAGWGNAVLGYSDTEAAGAIHSFLWPTGCGFKTAREFLNRADDGRLLQSALSADGQQEGYNPTEGGALASIQFATPSLSKLLMKSAAGNRLETLARMAFWKPVNGVQTSNYLLRKTVTMNVGPWNLIDYEVEFITPANESHSQLQFEIVTGYMPPEFSTFETLDRATRTLTPVSDGPGEQSLPLVFSTPDGEYAMGVWIPAWGNACPATAKGGYGRWRYPSPDNCVKWNAVQRIDNPAPGLRQKFLAKIAYGSKADVVGTLCGIAG